MFQRIFGSRVLYKSKRRGGWSGLDAQNFAVSQKQEPRESSLAREQSMVEGGSVRIGDGWLAFVWVKALDRQEKWRDAIQRNEIS